MEKPGSTPREPGERIGRDGRIALERVIGRGAHGAVWRARDLRRERIVAVKFLIGDAASNPITRTRFIREGRKFGGLRHANLVRVLQMGEDGEDLYLVAEYVEGRNLHEILREDGPFDVLQALAICRDAASGLHEAHRHSVVHRDLKPSNIMLRAADGCVKVLDFGIAKDIASDTVITVHGTFVGTPAYSSPEQIQGDPVDGRADVYSLGVIFYEMLAGPIDFKGRHSTEVMRAALRQERVPLNRLFELVTRPVARLIQRMTRKIPERRPESMQAVVQECTRLIGVIQGKCSTEDRTGIKQAIRSLIQG